MKRKAWLALLAVVCLMTCVCMGEETAQQILQEPEITVLGEGEKTFAFQATLADGTELLYEIHTDAQTVGEALSSLGLIEGEQGPWGLYIKTVCGETHDYATDGKYWAFYIDGAYAMSGVDLTQIDEASKYMLKAE